MFEHANALLTAVIGSSSKDRLSPLVDALLADIQTHFQDEEAIFGAVRYPGAAAHRGAHARLVARGRELAAKYASDTLGVGDLFHFFAYEVVAQHLLTDDRKFFPYLIARATVDD